MINILTSVSASTPVIGSAKVFRNLRTGLDRLGYPYVVGREPSSVRRLWVHNDVFAIPAARRSGCATAYGPNLFILPTEIPLGMRFDGAVYLQPSEWVKRLWERCGFDDCPIVVWPVGIDVEAFAAVDRRNAGQSVLVYHKNREEKELSWIRSVLEARRMTYRILVYGRYSESEYRQALAACRWVIWHGSHETQGIALQEALASDVPVLVCDASSLGQLRARDYAFPRRLHDHPVTSAPYFDDTCGVRITDVHGLGAALDQMEALLPSFRPREYVRTHLSIEGQAKAFIRIWERWGLSYDEGVAQHRAPAGRPWRPTGIDVLSVRIRRRMRLALGR